MRTIHMNIDGDQVTLDSAVAGVQGSGNVDKLVVHFDAAWDGYAKRACWWDSHGVQAGQPRVLTADLLVDLAHDTRTYVLTVPPSALRCAGMCALVIDGYADGALARTVSVELQVVAAPGHPEAEDMEPSQAQQLQEQVENLLEDMSGIARAAEGFRDGAEEARDEAERYKDAASISADEALSSADYAADKADYISGKVSQAEAARDEARSAQAAAEDALDEAEEARDEAERYKDAASISADEALSSADYAADKADYINEKVSQTRAARDEARSAQAAAEDAREEAREFRDLAQDFEMMAGERADEARVYANEAAAARNGAERALAAMPRPNLLDNWYFIDPINQRGGSAYSNPLAGLAGGKAFYGLDRWVLRNGDYDVATRTFTRNNGAPYLIQPLQAAELAGKTVTASVLFGSLDGQAAIMLGNSPSPFSVGRDYGNKAGSDLLLTTTVTLPDSLTNGDLLNFVTRLDSGSAVITAAKLELGDTQTLARPDGEGGWVLNDPPPDKRLELFKCQHYFQLFRDPARRPAFGEDFRPVMATALPAAGTLEIGGVTYYTASSEP